MVRLDFSLGVGTDVTAEEYDAGELGLRLRAARYRLAGQRAPQPQVDRRR